MVPHPTWQWQFDKAGELTETIDPMGRVYQQQGNPAGGWPPIGGYRTTHENHRTINTTTPTPPRSSSRP